MRILRVLALFAVGVALVTSPFWVLRVLWERTPYHTERIQLVDYTVPYVSGREHRGAVWLLNHDKYRPPAGDAWDVLGSHIGYDPNDREHPTPIARADLARADWLWIADSYGVYRDDLKQVGLQRAHMDYNPRLFGGLSADDARAIEAHVARGRHALLEFNTLEEPTAPEARERIERLLGVRWSGWTGRVFLDLYDTTDVPHWFPRLFRARFGHDSMPRGPVLALVHRDGRFHLIAGPVRRGIAPRIQLTPAGEAALGYARSGAPYFYWFPIVTRDDDTEVLAEFELPAHPGLDSVRALLGMPPRIPLLTRRTRGGGHRLYLAADLADTDFDPGAYRFYGLARLRAFGENPLRFDTGNPFWHFYVPAVRRLLRAPYDEPSSLPLAPTPATR